MNSALWGFAKQHAWKLLLLPLFFDMPRGVKIACALVLFLSLALDLVRFVRDRRQA
jgi:hypothetical protein